MVLVMRGMKYNKCDAILVSSLLLDGFAILPYGTGVTKGPRVFGGFYILSVLDSN